MYTTQTFRGSSPNICYVIDEWGIKYSDSRHNNINTALSAQNVSVASISMKQLFNIRLRCCAIMSKVYTWILNFTSMWGLQCIIWPGALQVLSLTNILSLRWVSTTSGVYSFSNKALKFYDLQFDLSASSEVKVQIANWQTIYGFL